MDQRLKKIVALLVVLLVAAIFFLTRERPEEKATLGQTPLEAVSTPEPRAPVVPSTARIASNLLDRVEKLGPEDQRGLEELFRDWKEFAATNAENYARLLSSFIQKIEKLPTARAFFLVQAMTLPGSDFKAPVGELLERRAENTAPSQGHEVSEKDRLDMIQSYALERTAGQARFIVDDMRSHPLVRRIAQIARENTNLLIVRESLQWLLKSVDGAAEPVREIILARGPEERHAVADLLGE